VNRSVGRPVAHGVIFLIQLYRHTISPLRLPTCRFTPTCSQYAVEALGEYGLIKGGRLSLVRLLKCGPWHRGGWDPIPERRGDAHRFCADAGQTPHDRDTAGETRDAPALREESETRV
jgi:putative membrane protein insertion efficiency factor